jgi:hypothetical protein
MWFPLSLLLLFGPVLGALSAQPKLATNGVLRLICGAVTLTCTTDDGDVKVSGLGRRLNDAVYVVRRGRFMGAGYGKRRFVGVALSERVMSMIAAASPGPMRDFVSGSGAYSANVSTLGAGQLYTIDVEYTSQDNTGSPSDVLYMRNVDFNSYDFEEGDEGNKLAYAGMMLGTASLNGVTISQEIGVGGT